jgi:phenylacetic acid degradation operon negative regulatory protein
MTLLGAYVQPRDRPVWSGGLVRLLAEFDVSPGTARVALTRLVARDVLARTKRGRLAHYTVTRHGATILGEGDARIFSLGRSAASGGPPAANGRWTVLWHTIPESRRVERTRLTRRLRFLGFGSLQDGTWLTPQEREHEVASLLDELELREHAAVMLGSPAASLDFRTVVGRMWDLDRLAARYRDFVDQYRPYITVPSRAGLDDRQAFGLRTGLIHTFRQFPFLDPELPADLVPSPPHRAEAVRLFHDLYAALAPAAQRHFDEVTTP